MTTPLTVDDLMPDPVCPDRGFIFLRLDGSCEVRRLMLPKDTERLDRMAFWKFAHLCPRVNPDSYIIPESNVAWLTIIEGADYDSWKSEPVSEVRTRSWFVNNGHCDLAKRAGFNTSIEVRAREYCRLMERLYAELFLESQPERIVP